jgi:hypothetical protein
VRTFAVAALTVLVAGLPLVQPLNDQPARQHDLRQIAATVERNETGLGGRRLAQFRRLAATDARLAAKPMPNWRYLGLVTSLIASLQNPHALVWPDFSARRYLPLAFYWTSDGLVTVPVAGSPRGIAVGDKVLSLGGQTPAEITAILRGYIAGSDYNVRYTACRLSYLSARYALEWLHAVDGQGKVQMVLENAQGRVERFKLSFVTWPDYLERVAKAQAAFADRFIAPPGVPVTALPYGWRVVAGRYGVFWLRGFDPGVGVLHGLRRFLAAVVRQGARNIVIDVQGDPGGYYSVVEGVTQQLYNAQYDIWRHAYIVTNWGSFSGSVLLAEEFLSLGIGPVVGEPTGEDLEVGGEQGFAAAETDIVYQLAVQPPRDLLHREAAAIYPSIPVPLTVRDVQRGTNPVGRWLSTLGRSAAH